MILSKARIISVGQICPTKEKRAVIIFLDIMTTTSLGFRYKEFS